MAEDNSNKKSIYDLELHETTTIVMVGSGSNSGLERFGLPDVEDFEIQVLRVPGGWVYGFADGPVFVPLTSESMPEKSAKDKWKEDPTDHRNMFLWLTEEAINLMNGRIDLAVKWLETPLDELNGESPWRHAEQSVDGAIRVEKLIEMGNSSSG